MQTRHLTVAVLGTLAALLAACGAAREVIVPEPAMRDSHHVAAYHPWWTQAAWRDYDASVYDEIYFFALELDSTGRIADRNGWPDRWFSMQRELTRAGARVTPVVTLFSQRGFEQLFSTGASSNALLETIVSLLRDSPAAGGIQLDFEVYRPVSSTIRSNFTAFVGRLGDAMDGIRNDLSLSLYMVAYDESDVFDEAALAAEADYLVVQGYDLHSRAEGRTGPVAALDGWGRRNWKTIVGRLKDLGVPPGKIVMSVPYFGYEWPAASGEPGARTLGTGVTISYAEVDTSYAPDALRSAREGAEKHGLRRDDESGSPYYAYQDSSGWRQGWFEDAESLRRKYRWVVQEGLRGVAVFPAAYGDDELESVLGESLQRPSL